MYDMQLKEAQMVAATGVQQESSHKSDNDVDVCKTMTLS